MIDDNHLKSFRAIAQKEFTKPRHEDKE